MCAGLDPNLHELFGRASVSLPSFSSSQPLSLVPATYMSCIGLATDKGGHVLACFLRPQKYPRATDDNALRDARGRLHLMVCHAVRCKCTRSAHPTGCTSVSVTDDHRLQLGVIFDKGAAKLAPRTGCLDAAEGDRGVEEGVHVDIDCAGLDLRDQA